MNRPNNSWRETSRKAKYWQTKGSNAVCNLCPRNCSLKPNEKGFCQVRGNVGNEIHTFNYGISVQATIENIETEAVNHYRPGAKILSMGNVGCMMSCSYCQNWQTSQVKYLNDKNVVLYSPEEVIELALKNDIDIISWTYNDPVVWQEFVVDTSRLAKEKGIKTLYKSALYIEEAPLSELIDLIDIFSISLKGMDSAMYKKQTKGELEPILARIKQIAKSDKHLEISQLIVTDLNDDGKDAINTAVWMRENIGLDIPLHLVAYHPAFKYTKERTSIDTLLKLRKLILKEGIKYCYLGNVYADDVSNTQCVKCNNQLVKRFGLSVDIVGLNETGECLNCGTLSPVIAPLLGRSEKIKVSDFTAQQMQIFKWNTEINSIHITVGNEHNGAYLKVERNPGNKTEYIKVNEGLERLIISKSYAEEAEVKIMTNVAEELHFLPVLDRAHFPVKNQSESSFKYLN